MNKDLKKEMTTSKDIYGLNKHYYICIFNINNMIE